MVNLLSIQQITKPLFKMKLLKCIFNCILTTTNTLLNDIYTAIIISQPPLNTPPQTMLTLFKM